MSKQGKIWGETEEIYNNGILSVNVLHVKKGGFCSEHQHARKSNLFHIVSGRLQIVQWQGCTEGEAPDATVAVSGESTAIPAGVWHQFEALEDTLCLEIYEVRFSGDDITRRTHGGMRP